MQYRENSKGDGWDLCELFIINIEKLTDLEVGNKFCKVPLLLLNQG